MSTSKSESHHRTSSSDSLFGSYFSAFTEEDFKKIDEAVTTAWEKEGCFDDMTESDFPSEIDGLNLNLLTEAEWAKFDDLPDIEQSVGGRFDSTSEINFEGESGAGNAIISGCYSGAEGPSIPIALEHYCEASSTQAIQMKKLQSPLRQFRRHRVLSVTDLTNPTWCEVQYDYGLRSRRSRPIEKQPATFKSAAGKKISVEKTVAQKNDVRKKQGLAIHKVLEREIRPKEIDVKATTMETQWALRIVNMMACLKELLYGPRNMTREIPVFGILHDEVVVGMIDEIVCELSVDWSVRKRKAKAETSKGQPKKRRSSPDVNSGGPIESNDAISDGEDPKARYTLHLRDAKTRNWRSIPEDMDSLAGRLQLHIYFTLLHNLIAREPPFDFDMLWKKLGVKPDAKLPTKFLVQAQLISVKEDLEPISLNDLVISFYELIRDQEMHLSPFLELVYYLRPFVERPKGKPVGHDKESPSEAVAGNCEDPAKNGGIPNEVGASRETDMAQSPTKESSLSRRKHSISDFGKKKLSADDNVYEEVGIRHFPLIGKKEFDYDEKEMNTHISRVLEWWHGERPPEGVPIGLTKRCRTCEYSNDCEWRDAKASGIHL